MLGDRSTYFGGEVMTAADQAALGRRYGDRDENLNGGSR